MTFARLKPYWAIWRLSWPLALGMVNNAVMQSVDRFFLAKDSLYSLEASLPATMLAWIFLSFFQSTVAYAGVFVAQYHGASKPRHAILCYYAAVLISLIAGLLMPLFVPLGEWVFSLSSPNPAVLARECAYYNICILGGFFVFGQMAAGSYFTGLGQTRIVFWVNVLGNVLNIILDPILIFGWCGIPALGMAGAAYATVTSVALQWLTLTLAAHRAIRHNKTAAPTPTEPPFRFSNLLSMARRILRLGIPSGGYSVLNTLSFTIFIFISGRVGDLALAVSNTCFTINYLLFAPMEGFALGAQTLVGQACGRGDYPAARTATRRTLILTLSLIATACALVLTFHRPLLSLFAPTSNPTDTAVFLNLGTTLLILMAAWLLFDATDVVLSGALKGAGDSRFVFWWMLIAAFLIWLPLVFLTARIHNTMPALWFTIIFYVVIISIGSFIRWHRGKWQSYNLTSTQSKGIPS